MNSEQTGSLYADPKIYDILYTPGTWRELDVLERIERKYARRDKRPLPPDRLWFEPACGSGRYLRTAAARGRRTAGFDRDEAMLRYICERQPRRSAPPPLVFQADMADFQSAAQAAGIRPASVAFAFNPVNSIRHLENDRELLCHLEQMAALLKPDAIYIVGISLTDYDLLLPEEDTWIGTRGRCRVTQLVNYLPPEPGTERARNERVISHLTIDRPGGTEHLDAVYDLRCYNRRQWQALVARSALKWAGSFTARGGPLPSVPQAYQWEVLVRRDAG